MENEKRNNSKKEETNTNLNNLMKYLADNLKAQNEENKNILAKMHKDKENSVQNDKRTITTT